MIKILSTGLNYPYVYFSVRIEGPDYNFTCYIEQNGSGNYVANYNKSITLPQIDPDEYQITYCLFVNETNYEMKIYDEESSTSYTLAPGGSKFVTNSTSHEEYYTITYTSPNPPPQTVDVQAIIMG